MSRSSLPTGTVTFVFTDIEGSTRLLGDHPEDYPVWLARHSHILQSAVEMHDGVIFETVGDAVYAAFASPRAAVRAALQAQQALHAELGGELGQIRVRMALHTGEAEVRGEHYFGAALYRCARLMAIAHGGQTVLSGVTAELVRNGLPPNATLTHLGMHELKDLDQPELVWQLEHPDLGASFPPLRSPNARPNNLPAQLTSFVGRQRELAEIRRLFGATRLLTLTGLGGTGKTRLALRAATDLLEEFPDGVWFTDLAPLGEPALVASTIAQVLNIRPLPGRLLSEQLSDALRDKQVLLVLDNFEHVQTAAPLVGDLLRACPRLRVLVTSRVRLRVSGEQVFAVPPLAAPLLEHSSPEELAEYPSVALFLARAQAAQPDFALAPENAAAVASICRALDGLPLALELAAARTRVLSPDALLARLDGPLKVLTGGPRDGPARHHTLRATLDWSYDLLTAGEQALFRRIGVFAAGCTPEASDAVCEPSVDLLDGLELLVDQGLLRHDVQPGGQSRFRMLATIREYALEQLSTNGELDALRRQHAEFFVALAERAEPELVGAGQGQWLDRLEAEHDNMRAALRWSLEASEVETGLRLAAALWRFWATRGYLSEGERWLVEVLSIADTVSSPSKAKALTAAGSLARSRGDHARAEALHSDSLDLFRQLGDTPGIARSLSNLGAVAYDRGLYALAGALYQESLTLRRELGDTWAIAVVLNNLGLVARDEGNLDRATSLYEESRTLFQELGDKVGIANTVENLGQVAGDREDLDTAASLHRASLTLRREVGDKRGIARSLRELGQVARRQQDYALAEQLLSGSLSLSREVGATHEINRCLELLDELAVVRLMGGASTLVRDEQHANS
ncbi:MAG TPA: tetratricopeptide repeat protein [Chloroflexota bacterium]|nr:tetratricopeptide repeat protein [Chloroflexota bacterium]